QAEESADRQTKPKGFGGWVRSLFSRRNGHSFKESIEEVMEEHEAAGDPIDREERIMLRNVLTFNELTVEDVMVPRSDSVWVDDESSYEDLKKILAESLHTRMPVAHRTLDDVAGFLHVKDVVPILANGRPCQMDDIIRQTLFVPPSM